MKTTFEAVIKVCLLWLSILLWASGVKNRLIVDIKVWDQESQGFFMIQGIIKLYASNIEKNNLFYFDRYIYLELLSN